MNPVQYRDPRLEDPRARELHYPPKTDSDTYTYRCFTEFVRLKSGKLHKEAPLSLQILTQVCSSEFLDASAYMKTLKFVELRYTDNKLVDQDIIDMADVIATLPHLKTLVLSHNKIKDAGAIKLAEVFTNKYLDLIIDDNEIGSEGAIALVKSLKENESILDLSKNKFDELGVIKIAAELKTGRLKKILLKHNNIGTEGDKALAYVPSQTTIIYRVKQVPLMELHPVPSLFLMMFIVTIPFVLCAKTEVEIPGCEHKPEGN